MKKFLTFLTLFTLFFGVSWAATKTATLSMSSSQTSPVTVNGVTFTWTSSNIVTGGGKSSGFKANSSMTVTLPTGATLTQISKTNGSNWGSGATIKVYQGSNNTGQNIASIVTGTNSYTIESNNTGGIFYFENSTSKNAWIQTLTITYEEGGSTPTNKVATPTFSPAAGTYSEAQNVTISCETSGATIRYTLDGNDPTATTGTVYTSPISVTSTTTIKAIATATGYDPSSVATATYTIAAPLTSLAAVNALAKDAEFTYGAETVVMGVYGNNKRSMYIVMPDNTAGTLVYDAANAWGDGYTFGQVIKGGWSGKIDEYNTKPEVINPTGFELKGETAQVTPIEITADNLTKDNFGRYAVVKNVSVGSDGSITGITTYNQFGISFSGIESGKQYDVYGVIGWHNGKGQFMPLSFEEAYIDPGEGYFLVGSFNNWTRYEGYKFTEAEGSLVLNNVTLPDNAEFKIVNKTSSSEIWYGGQTDNTDQDKLYVLHGGWHTDIPLTNSENNNKVKNFYIAAGGVTSFTFNTSTMKFDALRAAQVYFTCDKISSWAKEAMTATDNGWTITKDLEAGSKFAFIDEWGGHHGKEWTIYSEHYGDNYDIPVETSNVYVMNDAGYYKIDVNSALSVMHVNKEFAIKCSANPNGGGNVTAKVGEETVTSAMAGETVTIEYTTANGYTFNNITLNGTALEAVEGVYSFTMPNEEANVVANFTAQSFAITVVSPNGTTTCPETATTGSPVTFKVTPDEGYTVTNVTASFVNGENTTNVPVTYDEENDKYSFKMPPFPVTVKVNYKAPFVSKMYKKITSIDEIDEDLTYIVVGYRNSNTTDYVMGFIGEETYAGTVIATPDENGLISSTEDMAIVTIGENSGKYSFLTDEGYLNNSSNGKNRINAGDSPVYLNVSFGEEGVISITQDVNTYKTFTFNASSPRFAFYQNVQNGGSLYLYKEVKFTLRDLLTTGQDGNEYTITEPLLGVYKSGNTVWFKDEVEKTINLTNETLTIIGGSVNLDVPGDEQNYWIENIRTKDFDQSNWIEVDFSTVGTPEAVTGVTGQEPNVYIKNLTGTYSYNGGKRKLVLTKTPATAEVTAITNPNDAYVPNPYIPANFYGTQQGYFFSKPKVQEYAKVVDAKWDGTKMVMGTNVAGFKGSFTIEPVEGLKAGNYYTFHGIINRRIDGGESYSTPRLQAEGDYDMITTDLAGQQGSEFTAISTVGVNGEVKSVKYVSVAGVVSDRPFQGVNIVVTEYTDGSRTTAKVVK